MMTLQCVWLSLHGYVHLITLKNLHLMISGRESLKIREKQLKKTWPFGFINDGFEESTFVDSAGDVWKVDEYGDRSFMWEYK